jgi:DNA-binding XRE family transcriptional regulator
MSKARAATLDRISAADARGRLPGARAVRGMALFPGVESAYASLKHNFISLSTELISVITGDQIRMGRAALHITVRELAKRAKVTAMTVTRLENGHSGGYAETMRKIQNALEAAGVEFINGDSPGVRLKKKR